MIQAETVASFRPPLYASPQRLFDGHLPPTKGKVVADWIERWLVHGAGDSAGLPIHLAPHQRYVLNRIYEYDPQTLRLIYSHVVVIMGKGNSKTQDAGMIGIADLYGPVRPLRSPLVVTQAASYDQANNVFGAAKAMIENGPLASRFATFEHELYPHVGGGKMRRLAARSGTSDGLLPTMAIGDELHEWKTQTQRDIYVVQGANLRKRQVPRYGGISGSLQSSISTPGDNLDSVLGDLYIQGVKVAKGEVEDPRFLFICWEAPKAKGEDLDDPIQLRQAILAANPAIGHFMTTEQLEEAYKSEKERHQFERRHLARWVASPFAWLTEADWAACAKDRGQPPAGTEIVIGFKGSYDRNVTALVGWTLPNQGEWADYGFVIDKWEPDGRAAGWTVPRTGVDAALFKALGTWKVKEIAANPVGWVKEVEEWEKEFGTRRLEAKNGHEFVRGAGIVFRFENVNARMGPACDRFKGDVLGVDVDGKAITSTLSHSDDPAMARHIRNAHRRSTRYGAVIVQDENDSPQKIDIAEAAVIARQRAMNQPKPKAPTVSASF